MVGFFFKANQCVCSCGLHSSTLQHFIIDPAVSHCLLADSSFIAETSQQAFDGQEWGVFLSYQAQIIDHK